MKLDRLGRRAFLQGTSGCLLALPLLPSLFEARASAASPAPRLRFFAIKSYSTQRLVDWYPRYSGGGYRTRRFDPNDGKLDGTSLLVQRCTEPSGRREDGRAYFASFAPLTDLARGGRLSTILGPELNPQLARMLLLRGLDFMPETSHNDGGMLGNYAAATVRHGNVESWPTIDQVLAFSPRFYPQAPAGPRSLHLSLGQRNTFSFTHHGAADGPVYQVQAHTDPGSVFAELFARNSEPERGERRKLVDRVMADYRRVRLDGRLSSLDREVLEHHLALLNELENRLRARPAVGCAAPLEPNAGDLVGVDAEEIVRSAELMIDLALTAIRCDLTRIVTLDVWKAVGRGVGPNGSDLGYAHSSAKDARDWHERVHEFGRPAADQQVRAINQYIASEIFARVLHGLDQPEEQGQTYLDRALVFWGNELGMNHMNYSVPAVLAGSLGGRLRTGNYIDYIDWDQPLRATQENAPVIGGVPHNRLLVSILQAFGLRPRDYERASARGYGSYLPSGKNRTDHPLDYDASRYGEPLPQLLTSQPG